MKTPLALLAASLLGPLAWGAPGDLDPSFGDLGRVGPLAELNGGAWAVELQADGFLIGGGNVGVEDESGPSATGFVKRLSSTGTPDPAFSSPALAGIVVRDLARQSDGKIVGVGNSVQDRQSKLTVFRLEPDGALDPGFGDAGIVRYATDESAYSALSVALDPDGRLVVTGRRDGQLIVLAFDASGRVDTGFGDAGQFVGPDSSCDVPPLRTASGGYRFATSRPNLRDPELNGGRPTWTTKVLGLTAAGTLDPGFGSAGATTISPLSSHCLSMVEQADGSLFMVGTSGVAFAIRLHANGDRDEVFATDALIGAMTSVTAMAVAGNGSILVAGKLADTSGAVILRLLANGELDLRFGNRGSAWVDLPADFASAAAIREIRPLPDGGTLLAGSELNGDSVRPFVVRLIGDDGRGNPGVVGVLRSSVAAKVESGQATVLVRRSGGSLGPVRVSYQTRPQDATEGVDYIAVQGELQWANGDTSEQEIIVPIAVDTNTELPEHFDVVLSDPQGDASLGSRASVVAILPKGYPGGVLSLETSSTTVAEGDSVQVIVHRDLYAVGEVSVALMTTSGTAGAQDFNPYSVMVSWADGETSPKTITLAIIDDADDEPDESFTIALAEPSGGAIIGAQASGSITINDNDLPAGGVSTGGSVGGSSGGGGSVSLPLLLLLCASGLARRGVRAPISTKYRRSVGTGHPCIRSIRLAGPFPVGETREKNMDTRLKLRSLAMLALCAAIPRVEAQNAEIVIEWNQVLQANLPATVGLFAPRYYSAMHVAMFDAINSVNGTHSPYRVQVDSTPGASADAAAAKAARDVLVGLVPTGQAVFDAALAAQLANLPASPALQGSRVGQAVARNVLAWRKNDGSGAGAKTYVLPPFPGLWQPTPPGFLPPAGTQLAGMKPFGVLSTTQFLPEPPPTLTSIRYTADYHEVKRVGSATSTTRTADETLLAQQFAGVVTRTNLFQQWNNVARDTARSQGLSQIETARLYALLNVSINDGLQTSHGSKFIYGLWRPVTAIQRADEDLNSRTDADLDWMPLLVTPPYPSHSGNMACVGAVAARALALVHGTDSVPFTAVWLGNAANPTDTSRNYTGFWQMALDEARSRVVGGIHFSFENRASQKVCVQVPEFINARHMVPPAT